MQLEHELDRVVVEVAAVLDDLDEGGQAALARGHLGHGNGRVELPENCKKKKKRGGRREEPEHAEPGDAGADPTLLTGVVTATARAAAERWPRPASHGTVTAT